MSERVMEFLVAAAEELRGERDTLHSTVNHLVATQADLIKRAEAAEKRIPTQVQDRLAANEVMKLVVDNMIDFLAYLKLKDEGDPDDEAEMENLSVVEDKLRAKVEGVIARNTRFFVQ